MKHWKSAKETGRALRRGAFFLGSEGDTELESSPESGIYGRTDRERCPQGDTNSPGRKVPSARQGEPRGEDEAGRLAVSWFSSGCL